MNNPRDQHAFISYFKGIFLLAIGGTKTATCEKYNSLRNKWTNLPSLPKLLYNFSALVFQEIEVYLFFGCNVQNDNNSKDLLFSNEIYRLKLYYKAEKNNCEWYVCVQRR